MARMTNPELVQAVRTCLTDGFRLSGPGVKFDADAAEQQRVEALALTKEWRGELWQLMKEIERRLCPLGMPPSPEEIAAHKASTRI